METEVVPFPEGEAPSDADAVEVPDEDAAEDSEDQGVDEDTPEDEPEPEWSEG